MVWRRQRTSDDDVIVVTRRELGDVVVDRSVCLRDGDGEKQQRLRVLFHAGSTKPRPRQPRLRFIPTGLQPRIRKVLTTSER